MEAKRSKILLVSAILGVLYAAYIVSYFSGAVGNSGNGAEALGAGIASAIVMPHMLCAAIAAVFNAIGWLTNKRAFALTGGILYSAAAALMPLYAPFVLLQIVLSFVGFAKMKASPAKTEAEQSH